MKVSCPNCASHVEGVFCSQCGALLPYQDIDYFTLFGEERRSLLDEERLRQTYYKLSPLLHPDHFQTKTALEKANALQWSSLLNKAYSTLKDTKQRIRYLVSLETGADLAESGEKVTVGVSPTIMQLFGEVRTICEEVDEFIKDASKSGLRIVAASMAIGGGLLQNREKLERIKHKVEETKKELTEQLQKLDAKWAKSDGPGRKNMLEKLTKLGDDFSYLSKFDSLIEERLFQLSM